MIRLNSNFAFIFSYFFFVLFLSSCLSGDNQKITQKEETLRKNLTHIDIFYKTHKKDRKFLLSSLKTVDRFAKGFRKIVIVTDADDDLTLSDLNLHNLEVELFKEQLPTHWGATEKYNHQQYVKVDFKKWTDAWAILSLDSDVILYDLLTPNMYFSKKGKPVWLFNSYKDIFPTVNSGMRGGLEHWREVVSHFLKKNPNDLEFEFMRFPGFLITRNLADKFEQYIKNEFHLSLLEFMTTPSTSDSGKHTEFNYLGGFAYYLDPEKEYDLVDATVAGQAYARINKQIPQELENLFPATKDLRPYPLIQYHSYTQNPNQISDHLNQLLAEYPLWDFLHQPKNKYLLVSVRGTTGLANRIKSITSGLATAKLSGRKLCLIWDINSDMIAGFHDLFTNDIQILHNYRINNGKLLLNFKHQTTDLNYPEIINNDSDVILIDSWKSFSDKNVNFNNYLPLYIEQLKSLTPVPDVAHRVEQFVKQNFDGKRVVGIHFRSWAKALDVVDWNLKSSPIDDFFAKMDKELQRHPNTFFFIATDDQANKEKFIERYKDKAILSGISKIARDTIETQKDAFFEWLLLGKTQFIIGTNASTFSDEAALLTKTQIKINVGPNQFPGHDPLICFDHATGKPILCPGH